jgi:hypothetical protein
MSDVHAWYKSQLLAKKWALRKVVTADENYQIYTRGDREIFRVGSGSNPGTYSILYLIVPTPCATAPLNPDTAFGNCV